MASPTPKTIDHPLFGHLTYVRSDKAWTGVAALPRFAALGIPAPAEQVDEQAQFEMLAQAEANIKNRLLDMMRKMHGDKAEKLLSGLESRLEAAPAPAWPTELTQPAQGVGGERDKRL